jgi:hypothetical protein
MHKLGCNLNVCIQRQNYGLSTLPPPCPLQHTFITYKCRSLLIPRSFHPYIYLAHASVFLLLITQSLSPFYQNHRDRLRCPLLFLPLQVQNSNPSCSSDSLPSSQKSSLGVHVFSSHLPKLNKAVIGDTHVWDRSQRLVVECLRSLYSSRKSTIRPTFACFQKCFSRTWMCCKPDSV